MQGSLAAPVNAEGNSALKSMRIGTVLTLGICEKLGQGKQFRSLIDRAFDDDFRTALRGSAALAVKAGVAESEVLTSLADIDAFFG